MQRYTLEENLQILEVYYCDFLQFYGRFNQRTLYSSRSQYILWEFFLLDKASPQTEIKRAIRTKYSFVESSVEDDQNFSIYCRTQLVGHCSSTACTILLKYLDLRAYKVQLVLDLMPNDHQRCRRFADRAWNLRISSF